MITFEEMCRRNGLDPDLTRKIVKGNYKITITPTFVNDDKAKRENMIKLLSYVHDNWIDGVDVFRMEE